MITRTRMAAGFATLTLLVAAWAAFSAARDQHRERSLQDDVIQEPAHCGGEQRTLDAALSNATYVASLPTEGLIGENRLQATWDCPGSATLMEFSSGVKVVVVENSISNPAEAWTKLADSDPTEYSIGEVHGAPASLVQPRGELADGGVSFVVDGVHVSVTGNGTIPIENLVKAAETLTVASKQGA